MYLLFLSFILSSENPPITSSTNMTRYLQIIAFSDIQIIIMIVSSPICSRCFPPLQPELGKLASAWLSLVGQVCHKVFQSENKRTERKLFIREHWLQCCFLVSVSLFSLPSTQPLFHLFLCSLFSLHQFPLLSTYLALDPLSSPARLCLLPSQIPSSLA